MILGIQGHGDSSTLGIITDSMVRGRGTDGTTHGTGTDGWIRGRGTDGMTHGIGADGMTHGISEDIGDGTAIITTMQDGMADGTLTGDIITSPDISKAVMEDTTECSACICQDTVPRTTKKSQARLHLKEGPLLSEEVPEQAAV